MKKQISVLIATVLVVTSLGYTNTQAKTGATVITNEEEFVKFWFDNGYNDSEGILENDITFTQPYQLEEGEKFCARYKTLRGNGHTITDIAVKFDFEGKQYTEYGFGYEIDGCTVSDVIVRYNNFSIQSSLLSEENKNPLFGGFCGETEDTTFSNVVVEGDIVIPSCDKNDSDSFGGIVGSASDGTQFLNCENRANITIGMDQEESIACGIAIELLDSSVINCSNEGDLSSKGIAAGIVASSNEGAMIIGCSNSGNIIGAQMAAGIAGEGHAIIRGCYSFMTAEQTFKPILANIDYDKLEDYYTFIQDCYVFVDGTLVLIIGDTYTVTTTVPVTTTEQVTTEEVTTPEEITTEEVITTAEVTTETITTTVEATTEEATTSTVPTTENVTTQPVTTKKPVTTEQATTKKPVTTQKPTTAASIKATKITNVTAKKKALKITWAKRKGASGYQISYADNSRFKKAQLKTIKGEKKVSYTISKLKSKKKYYIKVRAYKTTKKGKNYTKWSTVKVKKTK